jgi:hypothetical protein
VKTCCWPPPNATTGEGVKSRMQRARASERFHEWQITKSPAECVDCFGHAGHNRSPGRNHTAHRPSSGGFPALIPRLMDTVGTCCFSSFLSS